MANLRATKLTVLTSSSIELTFTASLDQNIGVANIVINGAGGTTSGIDVKSVSISKWNMTVYTQPMVSGSLYEMVLGSTDSQPFQGAHGERLVEDGATNHLFFVGMEEESDTFKSMTDSLPSIYDPSSGSLLRNLIMPTADEIEDAKHSANEVGAANYVSIDVVDEEIVRGSGPYDRFANEGVFKLLRAGASTTNANLDGSIQYDQFPLDPVSLQQTSVSSEIVSNTSGSGNGFDGLLISVSKSPVISVSSIVLVRGTNRYTYDISTYRYGISESKYDSQNAYPALDIDVNQIRLSTAAVGPTFPMPQGNDTIEVGYIYKKLGISPDASTVVITSVVLVPRESVPAVATSFFLNHAPIVDQLGNTVTSGGIIWLNPAVNFDPSTKHPAFLVEIPFSESSLPTSPGEFAVNYSTGQVIVFGVDGTGTDGTTVVPPVATYYFLRTFQDGLDYNFSSDLWEIAVVPGRDLDGEAATISFEYEEAFAEGTDFAFSSHVESIDERIDNRLIGNFGLRTLHGPVNEVFRIFNETTGELYNVSRISGNQVFFESSQPPRLFSVIREAATFDEHTQAQIVVSDEITIPSKAFVAFKVELQDADIAAATGDYIGASFNSSLTFSDTSTFVREMYFDPSGTEDENLQRLQGVGDFMVDYVNGIAYVAVLSGSDTDIGDASYRFGTVKTYNGHITEVSNIYRSASTKSDNIKTFSIGSIGDDTVGISDLEHVGESDVDGDPILVTNGSAGNTVTVSKNALRVRHIFQVTDLRTSDSPVDFVSGSSISSSQPTTIVMDQDGVPVVDIGSGLGLEVQSDGSRKFVEVTRLSGIVSGITQLAFMVNKPADPSFLLREYWIIDMITGANLFALGSDGYIDANSNRIYLPTGTPDSAIGSMVEARYRAALVPGAAVIVDYTPGDIFIDYTYLADEILVSYEYGDNVLDWSISDTLSEGSTYYVSYRYGALRNSLRDNFGVLTGIDELSTAPLNLNREIYRAALVGSLQSFLQGPTIPAIKRLVSAFTSIDPTIEESVFFEWILGRDYLNLIPMVAEGTPGVSFDPAFAPGKFGDGILLDSSGQTATLPATSNMRFSEGTWECQLTPLWSGIDNDASLTFDILFDGYRMPSKVFVGSSSYNPEDIPFTLDRTDPLVLGRPLTLHSENGYFIWYDSTAKKWRLRVRAPIDEARLFDGQITSTGQFSEVEVASSVDGIAPADGYGGDEINDFIRSTDSLVEFSFTVDGWDIVNLPFDAYGSGTWAAFDGIDFQSDNVHFVFDTGVSENIDRMSLFKDGHGFLRYKVNDHNGRLKTISTNIRDWEAGDTHAVAVSWKVGTVEQRDELHLFVDGREVPNTYRFAGYLPVPSTGGVKYMDTAGEILLADAYSATVGGQDMVTFSGSDIFRSSGATFVTDGIVPGDRFTILDNTADGTNTRTVVPPYVLVSEVVDENTLRLECGGLPYYAISTLTDVKYSVNRLVLETVSDPLIEKVRVYSVSPTGVETELRSPNALDPDYSFLRDGYQDYVVVNNGVPIGYDVVLYSYGLTQQRSKQLAYIWPYRRTNLIKTIMPQPTAVSKIRITNIITRRINIEAGSFALIATVVGGHAVQALVSNLPFCQPSNLATGRRFSVNITGDNFDFSGLNQVIITGDVSNGTSVSSGAETLTFAQVGTQTTTQFFTSITSISAAFTPLDITKSAGAIEIREASPITQSENGGDYAQIRLSVVEQAGSDGILQIGSTKTFSDGYSRFGAEDINKLIYIETPLPSGSGQVFVITDVPLDPSGIVKDSDTVILSGTAVSGSYSGLKWQMLNLSFSDSGFANGLITLEIANSGGLPFLLGNCWYEVDFPSYAVILFDEIPETLYVGSDMNGANQASAVIDEMHILGEMLTDTGIGEVLPSSGISITSEANSVRELVPTTQSLALYHFNGCLENKAGFYAGFSQSYFQSSSSVNSLFGQSAVFDKASSMALDNKGIFFNNSGTIEFWANPIMDTYNDPARRYFIDLSTDQFVSGNVLSSLVVSIPVRARSVSSVTIPGNDTNFFTGGSLDSDGVTIHLGQPIPVNSQPIVTYVPITSQGDRFSIFKDENGFLVLLVTASGTDYQISAPIYWKKNTWHRIFVGWSLNNSDNQDRLILMVDGSERGTIRYGTGLRYGTGIRYGMSGIWGQAIAGTQASRNILADINMTDFFSTVYIGGDFTGQFPAMSKIDNLRFSDEIRPISYLGGSGPGQLIGYDLLYTSNTDTAQPVIDDALTTLLLDFDTEESLVEHLANVHDDAAGIFDFFVTVIDSFHLIPNQDVKDLIVKLIERLKPAHTRGFVDFGDSSGC